MMLTIHSFKILVMFSEAKNVQRFFIDFKSDSQRQECDPQ